METKFKNLTDIHKAFPDDKACKEYLEQLRWNGKVVCPHCGVDATPYKLKDGRYKCSDKDCAKKFSSISGTIFENTKLPLQKWILAIYLATAHKKGISSLQLSRDLGITQKTAWFVLHRVREMLRDNEPIILKGTVEADETYVGGKIKNKHKAIRANLKNKMSPLIKTPVLGILERNGRIITRVIANADRATVLPILKEHVSPDATMHTDSSWMYTPLSETHTHHSVNHSEDEYVRGVIHTQGIEGYWSLLKRGIIGIYHYVSPKHLQRYCDEFSYRYNTRQAKDANRVSHSITQAHGRRLKYNQLIKKV
jgi:transposase-like protein